ATATVIQYKIQLILGLERHVQPYNVRVAHVTEHTALCECVLHLVALDDMFFLQDFHCIQRPASLIAHEHHFAKTAFPDHTHRLELVKGGSSRGGRYLTPFENL